MNSLFDIINIPFAYVIRFFDSLTGNYLITLLLFAVVIKLVLFPFGIKQQKNMVRQAALRPKEYLIRAKYAGRNDRVTQQKMQQEIMELYQKEGYSPMSGCLPMIVQLIIVWAVYQIVYGPLTYILRLSVDQITKIKEFLGYSADKVVREISLVSELKAQGITNVSSVPGLEDVSGRLPDFSLWGNFGDLSVTPSDGGINWYWLIPVLVVVFSYVSMKMTRKLSYQPQMGAGDAAKSMKIMDITMPLLSGFISFSLPGAIGIYWIFQSLLGVLQQFVLSKMYPIPRYTDEELKALEKEFNKSNKQRKKQEKARVRSLHHIDDDDYDENGNLLPESQRSDRKKEKEDESAAMDAALAKMISSHTQDKHSADDNDSVAESSSAAPNGTENDDQENKKEADVSDGSSDVKPNKRENKRAERRKEEKLPPSAQAPIPDESDREKK